MTTLLPETAGNHPEGEKMQAFKRALPTINAISAAAVTGMLGYAVYNWMGTTPREDTSAWVKDTTAAFSTSLLGNLPLAASFTEGPLVLHDHVHHRTVTIHKTGKGASFEIVSDGDPDSKMIVKDWLFQSRLDGVYLQQALDETMESFKAGKLTL